MLLVVGVLLITARSSLLTPRERLGAGLAIEQPQPAPASGPTVLGSSSRLDNGEGETPPLSSTPQADSTRLPPEPSDPQVIVKDTDGGRLICTQRIPLSDGLVISIAFVVIPKDSPDATRIWGGLVALVMIDNDTTVSDFELSGRTITTLRSGKDTFTLFPPEAKDIGGGVRGLEYSSVIAIDLLSFLKNHELDTVTVQDKGYNVDPRWTRHLTDLVGEVQRELDAR
jgi:hypothetical protein